jgi:NDP-sugar pyrophosphorylase family protein
MDEVTCRTINAGIYVLEPEVLEHIPTGQAFSFERELFPNLLKAGKPLFGVVSDRYWIDIGTPTKYLEVHRDILSGRFTSPGVPALARPETFSRAGARVDAKSIIAEEVTLGEGARIESSVIGPNCKIDAEVSIVDSVIWSGNTIDRDAVIRSSILGRGCYVGHSATLREGTILGGKSVVTGYSSV